MRLFLDANILSSAAYRDSSPALLLFELAIEGRCPLVTSEFAWDEAYRNIRLKQPRRLNELDTLRGRLESVPAPSPAATADAAKHGLPDKDAPILAAAKVARVDVLVTGDRTLLGQALFRGAIRDRLVAARSQAGGDGVRVLLVVEDPDLRPLRWERLCAPDGAEAWDFLALDQATPYSRYLPSLADRPFPSIDRRDLRALVVLADPPVGNDYGLAPFDAAATASAVAAALGEIPHDLLGPAPLARPPSMRWWSASPRAATPLAIERTSNGTRLRTAPRWLRPTGIQCTTDGLCLYRTLVTAPEIGSSGFPVAKILNKNRFLVCWP